eukprot:scaffold26746_cov150-Skeletonema_menzelii.AAC.6
MGMMTVELERMTICDVEAEVDNNNTPLLINNMNMVEWSARTGKDGGGSFYAPPWSGCHHGNPNNYKPGIFIVVAAAL